MASALEILGSGPVPRSARPAVSRPFWDIVQARVFLPGGVAAPSGDTGYVANASGGIDAVDLATGRRLWTSADANLPAVALPGAVVAAALDPSTLRFVVLDATRGDRLFASERLGRGSASWAITTARVDRGILRVAWSGSADVMTGRQSFVVPIEDAVRVDLRTGRAERVSPDEVTGSPPRIPAFESMTLLTDVSGTVRYWITGERVAALALEPAGPARRLVLHTWDRSSGTHLGAVELFAEVPGPGYLRHHRSPDADHVFLVRCNDREQDGILPGGRCRWWIFAVTTGERVAGDLDLETDIEPALAVVGPRLFYARLGAIRRDTRIKARFLCARDVAAGRVFWEHEIAGRPAPLPASGPEV